MNVLAVIPTEVAWPLALLVAWVAGEVGHRLTRLPRISLYSLTGFALGSSQLGLLPDGNAAILLLANMAFGLILFELGYRINLRWLRANPWIGVSSLTEALLTFGGVFATARWFGTSTATALVVATLAMSTSPAGILRVVNEQRSAGQVTERVLLFSALSCALAVFAFKVIVGVVTAPGPGASWHAVQVSALVLVASAAVGSALGVLMPALLRALRRTTQDGTVAFAVAVVFLVALTHTVRLSPLVATLAFGLVARHRRVVLSQAQRGFGALGDLLAVLLFVYIAATLSWSHLVTGLGLGLALAAVRAAAKVAGVTAFARVSGLTWRKGLLTGIALTPFSAFVILVLEQTRFLGVDLVDQLPPLAAAALILEILGPILTQRALKWAHEVADPAAPAAALPATPATTTTPAGPPAAGVTESEHAPRAVQAVEAAQPRRRARAPAGQPQ